MVASSVLAGRCIMGGNYAGRFGWRSGLELSCESWAFDVGHRTAGAYLKVDGLGWGLVVSFSSTSRADDS